MKPPVTLRGICERPASVGCDSYPAGVWIWSSPTVLLSVYRRQEEDNCTSGSLALASVVFPPKQRNQESADDFFNTLWSLTDDYCSWIPAVHIVPALQNTTVTGKKQLYSSCARWLHKAGSCTTSFSSKRSVMHSVHLSHSLQLAERQCWKPRRRACVWRASFTVPPQARVVTQSCQLCASVFAEVKRKANYHLVLHFH